MLTSGANSRRDGDGGRLWDADVVPSCHPHGYLIGVEGEVFRDDDLDVTGYTDDDLAHVGHNGISSTKIANNTLTGADIANNTLAGDDLRSNAIGSRELDWGSFQTVSDSEEIVAGGTSMGNTATEVRAQCPVGEFAVGGGGYWDFPSGTLSGVRILGGSVLAEGRNGGGASQTLHAFVFCMP